MIKDRRLTVVSPRPKEVPISQCTNLPEFLWIYEQEIPGVLIKKYSE